jgi:glycerol-3-phosphate dehydrogenase
MADDENEHHDDGIIYDLVIIGGGVVGLAILRQATLQGYKCCLVEQEHQVLHWASGSNSGIICTGVDASPTSLERALIRDSIVHIPLFCQQMNIPSRSCGSLVCQWPWDSEVKLEAVLAESHEAGDTEASILTSQQVLRKEPNLNLKVIGAVHIPGEIVIDPWLFSIALCVHARENGARVITNFRADPTRSFMNDNIWTVVREPTQGNSSPASIQARAVVSATGVWADLVQLQQHGSCSWNAQPRRGQYRVFQASTINSTITHPVQPVPLQHSKGIFVFATMYDQIVVGPTALDQESRTDRSIDPAVADQLAQHAKRILPNLDVRMHVGDYAGIRPGTDQRDYIIQVDSAKRWIVCASIRSTGLTASLGIGRHVVRQLSHSCGLLPQSKMKAKTTPLPILDDMIRDFLHRNDGMVEINGNLYKVTHPLTVYGWRSCEG